MSRKPFALSAYLASARGRPTASPSVVPRPDGPLIWMHAARLDSARALAALAARIRAQRDEISVLLTWHPSVPAQPYPGCIGLPLPADTIADAQSFAAHWRPDIGLWTGQTLQPALLSRLSDTGTKLVHLDAGNDPWHVPGPVWLPDCTTATLALFDRIFSIDDMAHRRLRRLGLPDERLRRAGPLSESAPPLDCSPDLHEEMAQLLSGRPAWLAARVRADEAAEILQAHRRAIRLAHRLILFMVPASREDGAEICRIARASDLRSVSWDDGEMPDENTQVLVTEDDAELGLWYRLAPIAFLGGSLRPGHGGEDPLAAAAHGAALLYGPNVGRHLAAYTRLVEAGAARIVRDFDSLASAVSQLVAPDRAAAMAHAGWDVVSQGAALTDKVIAQVFRWLDGEDDPRDTGGTPGEAA